MKRGGPLKRRTRLREFSQKRRSRLPERQALVARKLKAAGYRCQAHHYGLEHECRLPLDVHEIIPRSAWPKGCLFAVNCVVICRAAHEWVDSNPDEAHAHGLHGYSWEKTMTDTWIKNEIRIPISRELMEDMRIYREGMEAFWRAWQEDKRLTREIGPWHGPRFPPLDPAVRLARSLRERGRLSVAWRRPAAN